MSFSLIWPIALIVLSNVFYNICSKETPSSINPFAALTVTYTVAAIVCLAMFFILGKGSLIAQYRNLSWSSFVLGLAVVGLEAGSIYMYQAGWNVSSGQMVYSTLLAVCLVFVGALLYKEAITLTKVAGILICMVGLFFMNR